MRVTDFNTGNAPPILYIYAKGDKVMIEKIESFFKENPGKLHSLQEAASAIEVAVPAMFNMPDHELRKEAVSQVKTHYSELKEKLYVEELPCISTENVDSVNTVYREWLTVARAMPYSEYLQTAHWQVFRLKAINNAGCVCQSCEACNKLEVHHRHYRTLGCETFADVAVFCLDCHRLISTKNLAEV